MASDWIANRLELLEVLRPQSSPVPLKRLGGNWDGAYLVPDDLKDIVACFSPGVSNTKRFEDELLDRYGIPSHMCDFTSEVSKFRTPLKDGQTFRKLWLDVDGAKNSISLEQWVTEEVGDSPGDLILQIDIEGAEYRNLSAASDELLSRFRIIVIELHALHQVNHPDRFARELGPLLDKLGRQFICVHAHPNNCEGDFRVSDSDLNLPKVHELTFLRRDRFKRRKKRHEVLTPHPLDIPQNVIRKPPVFLNEAWLEGERPLASQMRMLKDELAWATRRLSDQETEIDQAWRSQHRLATASPESSDEARDLSEDSLLKTGNGNLASGASFSLSSWHGPAPVEPKVQAAEPCFFQTGLARHQSITVDLGNPAELSALVIVNRSDRWSERADQLFVAVHDKQEPDELFGRPIARDEQFLSEPGQRLMIDLNGKSGRYVTVYSTALTTLHFSDLQVWGRASS